MEEITNNAPQKVAQEGSKLTSSTHQISQSYQQLVDKLTAIETLLEYNPIEQRSSSEKHRTPVSGFNILNLFKPEEILSNILKQDVD